MKTFKLFPLLIAALLFFSLPAWNKSDDKAKPEATTEELLIGQWIFSSSSFMQEILPCDYLNNITFQANGEITRTYYHGKYWDDCSVSRQVTFPYRIESGDKIITTIGTKEKLDTSFTFTILDITDKVLILQSFFNDNPNKALITDVYLRH